MTQPQTAPSTFTARVRALSSRLGDTAALLPSGKARSRNYPANRFAFRAESHFLFTTGLAIAGAALLVHRGKSVLFVPDAAPDDALWHGEVDAPEALRARAGADEVRPTSQLAAALAGLEVATIPSIDDDTAAWQSSLLSRPVAARSGARLEGADAKLADGLIAGRLCHDEAALAQIRASVDITTKAHHAGARATRPGVREAHVRAAIEAEFIASGGCPAYGSIVTVHGEVLHNEQHHHLLREGDLLLVDAGAENGDGWASDVTRVYPVSGRFSASQRAIYDVVLAANRRATAMVKPGVRYRDVHHEASLALLEGLVDLRILKGSPSSLHERGAHALFFPHGVGHLLGLDVHDMEDLGDRAGYAPGRTRAARFGDCYLRLDRDLEPGMVVTIEPGFYQVPAILQGDIGKQHDEVLDRERLAAFADVRGIRLEDDVLCTPEGHENLTRAIPIDAGEVEAWVRG